MAGPALLALCLLLLHRHVSSSFLTVDDLPATKQRTMRLLAAITVSENVTSHFITKQLWSYAEACEAGFEVHVVLVAIPSMWDNADKILFPTPSRYYCLRLQMLLPVVLAAGLPGGLAHQHRHVFSQLVLKYDLFLSQEHDIDVSKRNLLYWTHWRQHFKNNPTVPHSDKPVVPGFLRHEVSMLKQDNTKLWHQPAVLIRLSPLLSVISSGNATCFAPHTAYPGFYLVDRPMLQLAMRKKAWQKDADAKKELAGFKLHHFSAWQWYYFQQAIPLTDMDRALVHHGTDQYTPGWVDKSSRYSDDKFRESSKDAVDALELEYIVSNCMGQVWDGSKLPFPYPSLQGSNTAVGYGACSGWGLFKAWLFPKWFHANPDCLGYNPDPKGGRGPTPCADCARQGQGSALTFKLSGPTLAARPMKPKALFLVEVMCIDDLTHQETAACKNEWCEDHYRNVTKNMHS